ncbi:hypothetical protein FQA39_LY10951 [Lamprigera yunnana]|nr:hypothetical protein FQA39_LY10951 [Lamprigera yunnana]
MESKFRTVVEQIFNNWTAIRLAVEHGMGGPNSQQVALECVDYITQFCLNQTNIQISDIQEALEDILDEEFDTMCEDNSPFEVASLLHRFLLLINDGNLAQCEIEYQNLPTCKAWLPKQVTTSPQPIEVSVDTENEGQDNLMEEDSNWSLVKSRRRK